MPWVHEIHILIGCSNITAIKRKKTKKMNDNQLHIYRVSLKLVTIRIDMASSSELGHMEDLPTGGYKRSVA